MNNLRLPSFTLPLVLVGSLLTGCSSSTDETSGSQVTDGGAESGLVNAPPIVTSLKPEQRLSDLNDADYAKWCKDVTDYSTKTIDGPTFTRFSCALMSSLEALDASGKVDVAKCQASYDKCVKTPVPSAPMNCADRRADAKKCPATVAQVDACLQEQAQQVLTVAGWGALTCDASKVSVDSKAATAKCTALPAGCEGFQNSGPSGS